MPTLAHYRQNLSFLATCTRTISIETRTFSPPHFARPSSGLKPAPLSFPMERLDLQTPDFAAANIDRIAALFPSCVTETKKPDGTVKRAIDFDLLRQELSHDLVEGPQERYRLDWPGKRAALALANEPIRKTLRPSREESVDFDTTHNLYIEGDNLDALKLLQETYLGKVKMIYIDPTYNTGNDFIYDDDFSMSRDAYESSSGEVDEEGNALFNEEKWKQNSSSNGRFHSEWLSMIYPRIKLARNLLSENGFLIVSIDDAEVSNLKRVIDEVFGPDNQIASLVWDRNRKNDAKFFSVGHEYMLVYARSKTWHRENQTELREPQEGLEEAKELFQKLRSRHQDNWEAIQKDWRSHYRAMLESDDRKKLGRFSKIGPRGPFRDDGNINWPGGGGPRYDVKHPRTGLSCKLPTSGWRFPTKKRFDEEVASGRIVFGPDESTVPRIVSFLFESSGKVMQSVHYSYAQTASNEFENLTGGKFFDNPKNWRDLHRLVRYLTERDSIILDFFSGSATTAHAVMQLNAEDGGNRRHIMVQLPEPCDEKSEAFKAGYTTIAEIGKERMRRAGKKVLAEWQAEQTKEQSEGDLLNPQSEIRIPQSPPDIGFRVLKIDSSNMADVYYQPDELKQDDLLHHVDNLKKGRTPEDLLFQVLLDWGVDLGLPIVEEQIAGKRVFFIDDSKSPGSHPALAACFDFDLDEAFIKELAKRAPLRAVFRDAGYASDAAKINFEQIFKALSPHTELKTL